FVPCCFLSSLKITNNKLNPNRKATASGGETRTGSAVPALRGSRGRLVGEPASQTIQKPQAQYPGEARSSGVVPCRVPSLNEECALMHPLQGASFLSTPLQGGILKPPALRVVGDCRGA